MARTVSLRTVESYTRDLQGLLRLRTAIMIDPTIDSVEREDAIKSLDKLVDHIRKFIDNLQVA